MTATCAANTSEAVFSSSDVPRPLNGALSKAAVRRLAHDAGVRMMKDNYEGTMRCLIDFMKELFRHSCLAMEYSKKKSVNTEHVYYALQSMKFDLPEEMRDLTSAELTSLRKCNVHAAPGVRKSSPLTAEISEASFTRLAREVPVEGRENLRMSSKARHLIQLICELYLVRQFALRNAGPVPFASQGPVTKFQPAHFICKALLQSLAERGLTNTSLLDEKVAEGRIQNAVSLFDSVTSQIPFLLHVSASKTIDRRLFETAVISIEPSLASWCKMEEKKAAETVEVDRSLDAPVKILSKVLRGQIVDKRITSGAMAFLCRVLEAVLTNEQHAMMRAEDADNVPPIRRFIASK